MTLSNGISIAGRHYGPASAPRCVLCLHGWQDSAATWERLAPLLLSQSPAGSLQLFAMDFSGMGLSSHTHVTAAYATSERIFEVIEVADQLKWRKFSLMGHSFGGGIAAIVAGTFHERIDKLILVDPVGPLYPIPVPAPDRTRRAYSMHVKTIKRSPKPKVYATREAATARYIAAAKVSQSSADILMRRQLQRIEIARDETVSDDGPTNIGGTAATLGKTETKESTLGSKSSSSSSIPSTATPGSSDGWVFRHDPALLLSVMSHSEDDVRAFLSDIHCPVLYIVATNPDRRAKWQKDLVKKGGDMDVILNPLELSVFDIARMRVKQISSSLLQLVIMEGSHHLHLDSPSSVLPTIDHFLKACGKSWTVPITSVPPTDSAMVAHYMAGPVATSVTSRPSLASNL